jgi:hypothetical protein
MSVFFSPTCWAVWDLLWVVLHAILLSFRKILVLTGLRRKQDVSDYEDDLAVNDVSWENQPSADYNVFLVEDSVV